MAFGGLLAYSFLPCRRLRRSESTSSLGQADGSHNTDVNRDERMAGIGAMERVVSVEELDGMECRAERGFDGTGWKRELPGN